MESISGHVQEQESIEPKVEYTSFNNMEARIPTELKFEGNVAENFKKFKQNVEIYLNATGKIKLPDEVKVAIFLNLIGEEGVEVYNTLALSEENRKKFDKVLEEFEKYTSPRKNVVYERFKFFSRKQEAAEGFDHFVTDLKKLAPSCEFGEQKDGLIRDRIVLGVNNKCLQEKLLAKQNLNLEEAEAVCRSWEITKDQVRSVQEDQSVLQIRKQGYEKMKKQPYQSDRYGGNKHRPEGGAVTNRHRAEESVSKNKFLCYRCRSYHGQRECKAYGQQCRRCGWLNHFEKACRVKIVKKVGAEVEKDMVPRDDDNPDEDYVLSINSISTVNVSAMQRWYVNIDINDTPVKCKLDSGADVNIMPLQVFKKYCSNVELKETKIILKAFGNFKIKPVGYAMVSCEINKKKYDVKFIIVDTESDILLGCETCIRAGLIGSVQSLEKISITKDEFIKQNVECFTGLGKFKEKCAIHLKNNVTPIAKPPRRIPLQIRNKLKQKLCELESMKIIPN